MAPYFRFNVPCGVVTTSTTTTTTTVLAYCYSITNEGSTANVSYLNTAGNPVTESVTGGSTVYRCAKSTPVGSGSPSLWTIIACTSTTVCTANVQCNNCT